MKLKTKDGKYFSELGSWSLLLKAFIFVVVYKIFGLLIGTIIVTVMLVGYYFFTDNRQLLRKISQNIKNYFIRIFHFLLNNWFSVTLVVLATFAIYWFGIRPVTIRKSCTMVKWTQSASPEVPASENWPECQEINPFNSEKLKTSNFFENLIPIQGACYPSIPSKPETTGERKATDGEYKACLRENGI